ncbi:MAG: methionine--tRNA ligase [Rickettsiaceae bacterium]
MSDNNFYITTPIYYVNDVPHIGHAYTSLTCDVIARFMKLNGKKVKFLTGTDEHGQKVEKSALNNNLSPQEFTNKMSMSFRNLLKALNISNSDFIRTTEKRHKLGVQAFWQKLKDNGDIYSSNYCGWYSIRDEAFYDESELTPEGLAPTGAQVEWVEEPSYFFALSKWQDKLLEFYENNPDFIRPKTRKNEVISFVKNGLTDLSISRTSFKWGIPVPNDTEHVIYVWLDALTNYISALGYPDKTTDYKKFWPANVHVVGKDILRFHAVYWPAFLMSADLPLLKSIFAHGWWTNEGQKISKSVGNVIDPFKLIEDFGLDQVRYFLTREVIFGNDGNYARENLIQRNNSELSNKIGNLMQRTCSFIFKNCQEKMPEVTKEFVHTMYQSEFFIKLQELVKDSIIQMENYNINAVLDNIIYVTEQSNIYIDQEAPWALKNSDPQKMNKVLYRIVETLRYIAILMQPFTPDSATKMLNQLSISETNRNIMHLTQEFAIIPSSKIIQPLPIFPRLELEH